MGTNMAETSSVKRKARIKVTIRDGDVDIKEFEGRFLGFISSDECNYLINRGEIAHKAFTSQSSPLDHSYAAVGRRALVATTTYHEQYTRSLFITPVIKYSIVNYSAKTGGQLILTGVDNKEYILEDVVK